MSEDIFGLPGARDRDRQRQYSRNPLRCHWTTVDGFTNTMAFQGLRPYPVKPHPEQPICREKLNSTFALAPQDGHLMPQGDELKLQAGAAPKAE